MSCQTMCCPDLRKQTSEQVVLSAVTKALIGRGEAYSYTCVLPDEFLFKSTVMTTDFKINLSGRTRIYTPPPN